MCPVYQNSQTFNAKKLPQVLTPKNQIKVVRVMSDGERVRASSPDCLLSGGLGPAERLERWVLLPRDDAGENMIRYFGMMFFFFSYCWSQTAGGFGPTLTQQVVQPLTRQQMWSHHWPTTTKHSSWWCFKMRNSSVIAALDGFSGVFMSKSALQDTSWSVSERPRQCFFFIGIDSQNRKKGDEFIQNSKES